MLTLHQPAPDFTLLDQDNREISLHALKGKWVALYFYPKDDTPACTEEACGFRDSMEDLLAKNIVVLGISKDTVRSHKKFADKFKLNFSLLADTDHSVIESYGAWQEKSMFGKKYMGIQRMTVIINPEGNISHIFPNVTARGHEQEILAAIEG